MLKFLVLLKIVNERLEVFLDVVVFRRDLWDDIVNRF